MRSAKRRTSVETVKAGTAEEKPASQKLAESRNAQDDDSPENQIDPDVALESLSTDELLDHLKDVLDHG